MRLLAKPVSDERREKFVLLLNELTTAGKIEWARSSDVGHVYCLLGEEYINFEILGEDIGHVPPESDKIAYVAGYCRNVCYFWAPIARDLRILIAILKQAPIDDEKCKQFREATVDLPTKVLERLAAIQ